MNFFETQDRARRRTKWLVFYFICAVVAIVFAAYFGVIFGMTLAGDRLDLWEPGWFISIAGVTCLLVFGGSIYKSSQLRQGGRVVAKDLGGRLVLPHTRDPEERQLLNVVAEMAIASGTPVPQVYVMDEEMGINAFAAGTKPSNAVIGVTRGCLQLLSRSELQGVVAHEFSHIHNGDMRLNMRLIAVIFGLLILMLTGRIILHSILRSAFQPRVSSGNRRDRNGGDVRALAIVVVIAGVFFLVGGIGAIFARLIQAAVSRQREFLADASAVQFTREPAGLAGALKKIGGWNEGSSVRSPQALAVSHMFFAEGGLFKWGMATHPPLQVRIRALEPDWVGGFDSVALNKNQSLAGLYDESRQQILQRQRGEVGAAADEEGESGAVANLAPVQRLSGSVNAMVALSGLGQETRWSLEAGQRIHDGLDERLRSASQDRGGAQRLIFAMLLSRDRQQRQEQVEGLRKGMGSDFLRGGEDWQELLESLHSAEKIALLDLCMPTLRHMSQPEYGRFIQLMHWIIATDEKVDLFEFMLQHAVTRHLAGHFEPDRRKVPAGPERMDDLPAAGNVLLTVMARMERTEESAARAFQAAVKGGNGFEGWSPELLPEDSFSPEEVRSALVEFETAAPMVKKTILQMCGFAAAEDGILTSREAELLRAVADAIGVSLPPFVRDVQLQEVGAEQA
jgi:Zn-dependent protease with chaperone function/uncharacterized tellurite resistance protein B-like protein